MRKSKTKGISDKILLSRKSPLTHPRKRKRDIKGKKKTGPMNMCGSEKKRMVVIARAWELRVLGYSMVETQQAIKDEFNLPVIPSRDTMYRWLRIGSEHLRSREDIQNNYLYEALETTRAIRKKFLPIALEDNLLVMRKKMQDGEISHEVCEERFKEQNEAAKTVLAASKHSTNLLGLGRPEVKDEDDAKGFHLTLIKSYQSVIINAGEKAPPGKNALTLSSGDDMIDELEAEIL